MQDLGLWTRARPRTSNISINKPLPPGTFCTTLSDVGVFWQNIAIGTMDPRHWVIWLTQHLEFKAEASTNFGQTSACNKWKKSIYKFREIHVSILTNPCNNFDKSNNLCKIQQGSRLSDKTRQWFNLLGLIKILLKKTFSSYNIL